MKSALTVWVIYERPSDHPDHFVLRAWDIFEGEATYREDVALADSLEQARTLLPLSEVPLVRLPRHPSDDAPIVESWI